jgi:formylglycine-generating enzyme required for sulfatase activity
MHISLHIEADVPRWVKRASLVVVLAVPVALGYTALADSVTVPDTFDAGAVLTAAQLNADFQALQNAINNADPQCPMGYSKSATLPNPADANSVLCTKGVDQVVKVGTGGSAFWIDQFEASVWSNANGTGTQYGGTDPNGNVILGYPATFPNNGQRTPGFVDLYAVSAAGVPPSGSVTWFQAQQACRASGKRLPSGEEWLAAASGTNDPGSNTGTGGACVTNATGPRSTGGGTTCVSAWGAQDMIGNLYEWTGEWYAGVGTNSVQNTWEPGYGGDGNWNIVSAASGGASGAWQAGEPSAAVRGGDWADLTFAGVFSLNLATAPSYEDHSTGFRCILSR